MDGMHLPYLLNPQRAHVTISAIFDVCIHEGKSHLNLNKQQQKTRADDRIALYDMTHQKAHKNRAGHIDAIVCCPYPDSASLQNGFSRCQACSAARKGYGGESREERSGMMRMAGSIHSDNWAVRPF